jgi:hypothetical protein
VLDPVVSDTLNLCIIHIVNESDSTAQNALVNASFKVKKNVEQVTESEEVSPKIESQERMRYLLKRLSLAKLDRKGSKELRSLLQLKIERVGNKGDTERDADLSLLSDILSSYIKGTIDLMINHYKTRKILKELEAED